MWITSYVPREYTIRISDDTTGAWTTLSQPTSGFPFTAAQGGVLEVYGITDCSEFPTDVLRKFYNIWISQVGPNWDSQNWVEPQWSDNVNYNADPNCGYAVSHVGGYSSEAWLFF